MSRPLDRDRSALGEVLQRLRAEHGNVSQGQLSRRTAELGRRVSSGHIGQIETGDRGASLDTLMAFAQALRLSDSEVDELLSAGGHRRPTRLGDTLGRLRRRHGLSRSQLASRAKGVSDDDLARIEAGDSSRTTVEMLDALASALELSHDERQALYDSAAIDIGSPSEDDRRLARAIGAEDELREMDERIRRLEAQIEQLLSRPPDPSAS